MINDEKIRNIWESIIETNRKYVQTHKCFTPACFILNEDCSVSVIMMIFNDSNAKEIMKQKIKKLAVSKKIRGYIICMDAKLTKMNPKTNEVASVTDAIVHNLFSPKQKATYVIEYDSNRKITKEYGSPDEMVSDWDVWNYKERDEAQKKIESDYAEYKQKHPDKYKGVL